MTTLESRAHRIARLQSIPDDDQIAPDLAQVGRLPERRRVLTDAGLQPVVPLRETLIAEVKRTAHAHEQACEDLRRFELSHGNDQRPKNGL